jgi:hypothetical protein
MNKRRRQGRGRALRSRTMPGLREVSRSLVSTPYKKCSQVFWPSCFAGRSKGRGVFLSQDPRGPLKEEGCTGADCAEAIDSCKGIIIFVVAL